MKFLNFNVLVTRGKDQQTKPVNKTKRFKDTCSIKCNEKSMKFIFPTYSEIISQPMFLRSRTHINTKWYKQHFTLVNLIITQTFKLLQGWSSQRLLTLVLVIFRTYIKWQK
jgi:hypothetical protein